jgi:glycosyltransferase involved in cell wall biosynthesis
MSLSHISANLPTVSIGMPVCNCASTLRPAIASILCQTFQSWELIILDDGSKDDTAAVAKSFRDPRIRVIEGTENLGLAARLNQAVSLSRGDYFARMDGDDISYPERLQVQVDWLKQHPEIDLLGAGILIVDGDAMPIGVREGGANHAEIRGTPWRGFYLPHVTWIGKTSWFSANPYDPAAYYCQDRELLMRTHRDYTFASLPDILVAVREAALSARKLLRARRINFRTAIKQGMRQRDISLLSSAPAEVVKAAIDCTAIKTGLRYELLRHRIPPLTIEAVERWNNVRELVDRAAETPASATCSRSRVASRDEPLISIGMPVYNSARTVELAVRSIFNQTFENWELIAVDDGSDDGTLEILRGFRDPRIRVVEGGSNRGLPARLNQAVALSRGQLFARMDGDDISYPERLAVQWDYLRRIPKIDLLAASAVVFTSDGSPKGVRRGPIAHSQLCARQWISIRMVHPTWLGRIEWFRANPYDENAVRMEDYELLLRTHKTSCFASLPQILLGYREDALSLRRMLVARKHICGTLWDRARRGENRFAGGVGILSHSGRAVIDAVAISTRLDYRLLRTRAGPITPAEISSWQKLWQSMQAVRTEPAADVLAVTR